jgi:hypothetical protein
MHYFLLVLVDAANYLIQVGIKKEAVSFRDSLFFYSYFLKDFALEVQINLLSTVDRQQLESVLQTISRSGPPAYGR